MRTTAASVAAVLALALAGAAIAGTPSGYRDATQHQKHQMNGAVDEASSSFQLNKRFAWLIQRSDERFGVVCGHHHGVSGDYLKRRHGHGWHVLTNSGAVQLAFSVCKKAHH
jgi:hypothetical protein